MASITSLLAQGPRPAPIGVMLPNEVEGQRNTLNLQAQQVELEKARVREAAAAAAQRERDLRDQQIIADHLKRRYAVPQPETDEPAQNAGLPAQPPERIGVVGAPVAPVAEPTPAPNLGQLAAGVAEQNGAPGAGNTLAALAARSSAVPQQTAAVPQQTAGLVGPTLAQIAASGPQSEAAPAAAATMPTPKPQKKNLTQEERDAADEADLIQNGISAPGLIGWKAHTLDVRKKVADLTKEQAAIESAKAGRVAEKLSAAGRAGASFWPQARAEIVALEPSLEQTLPRDMPSPEQIALLTQGMGHYKAELAEAHTKSQIGAEKERQRSYGAAADQAERSNTAADLIAAAESEDPATYKVAYDRLSADQKASGRWPAELGEDADETINRLRTVGSSVKEQVRSEQVSEREDRLRQHAVDMRSHWTDMAKAATERNKIAAAKGGPTANAYGVQNRFDRRMAADLDRQEGRLHADLSRVGQILASGVVTNPTTGQQATIADKSYFENSLKSAQDRLQTVQFSKAQLHGFQAPDRGVIQKAPEGADIPASDGSIWKKHDGVAYWDSWGSKGAAPAVSAPPAAPAAPASAPTAPKKPGSTGSVVESEARKRAAAAGASPAQVDAIINDLKQKGYALK